MNSMIDAGQFERIFHLPQEALAIFEVSGAPDVVIAWADLAGDAIDQVVEMELYRVASPSDFRDRADLERILALEDAAAIQKLMLLNPTERNVLLGLAAEKGRSLLLADLTAEQLSWLTGKYLAEMPPQERNLLADYILRQPVLMSELENELVRQTLLESQNIQAALDYLTQGTKETHGVGQVVQMLAAIGPVLSGDAPWALFWHKYATTLGNPPQSAVRVRRTDHSVFVGADFLAPPAPGSECDRQHS